MFFKSILDSTTLLTNPNLLFLIFLWLFLQMIYLIFIRLATSPEESRQAAAPGCLTLILGVLWNGVWLGAILYLAIPIIFKSHTGISWDIFGPQTLIPLRSGLIGVLAMTALTYLPYLGKIIAGSPGLETLGAGLIATRLYLPSFLEKLQRLIPHLPLPSPLEILGIFLIFLILSKLTQVTLHLISVKAKSISLGRIKQSLIWDLGFLLDNFWGILFVFMYGFFAATHLS